MNPLTEYSDMCTIPGHTVRFLAFSLYFVRIGRILMSYYMLLGFSDYFKLGQYIFQILQLFHKSIQLFYLSFKHRKIISFIVPFKSSYGKEFTKQLYSAVF